MACSLGWRESLGGAAGLFKKFAINAYAFPPIDGLTGFVSVSHLLSR